MPDKKHYSCSFQNHRKPITSSSLQERFLLLLLLLPLLIRLLGGSGLGTQKGTVDPVVVVVRVPANLRTTIRFFSNLGQAKKKKKTLKLTQINRNNSYHHHQLTNFRLTAHISNFILFFFLSSCSVLPRARGS